MVASVVIEAVKFVGFLGGVVAVMFVFPFILMWLFRHFALGTQRDHLNTIRKIR